MLISKALQNKLTENGWLPDLEPFFKGEEWSYISRNLESQDFSPKRDRVFAPLINMKVSDVKCVIIGSNPYIKPNLANGFAFAVDKNKGKTPEISNIIKELEIDMEGFASQGSYNFSGWIKQGVLMINDNWTTGNKGTHEWVGWGMLTDSVLKAVANNKRVVFIFLNNLKKQNQRIPISSRFNHLVIETSSPDNNHAFNGFFGCNMFSKTNGYLRNGGVPVIDWLKIDAKFLSGEVILPKWTQRDELLDIKDDE